MSARHRPAVARPRPSSPRCARLAGRRAGLAGERGLARPERGRVASAFSTWIRRVRPGFDALVAHELAAAGVGSAFRLLRRTLDAAPWTRRGGSRRHIALPAALTPAFAGPYHRCFGAISAPDLCLPSTLTGLRESFP
jgi:hypothetical protein